MLKFGPFSGHFDYLARILVLARNFGSTGSSEYVTFSNEDNMLVTNLHELIFSHWKLSFSSNPLL